MIWISEERDRGETTFRVGRAGDELVADFAGIGVLRAKRSGESSAFEPAPGAHPIDVAKLRAGLVPALLRHLQRKLTLHGAAIAFDGIAIACIGESGAGKSTMAARLCAAGGALVADDTAALEVKGGEIAIVPTEAVHWLVSGLALPDPQGEVKEAVEPRARARAPLRLAAVCHLRFDDAEESAALRRLRGQNAVRALLPSVIRFILDEPDARAAELEQIAQVVGAVPIFELVRSRAPASLDESVSRLVELTRTLRMDGPT